MKITKEALRQVIKEELNETPNLAVVVMFVPVKAKFHGGGYP